MPFNFLIFFLRKRKQYFFLISFFLLSSCASSTTLILTKNLPNYSNKRKHISVYLGSAPIRSFPLAMISVVRYGADSTWTVEALKEEAAELGADAIINLDIRYSTGFFLPKMHAKGLAVKYGKL